jgi:sugar phosphate isomerase/epimerase
VTIRPGLCSITFRALTADQVLELAIRAGVEGIEWGADGHAPPGGGPDVERLRQRCRDSGIAIVSYGSYLGMGSADADEPHAVAAVLDSAEMLGSPMVRIWTEFGVGPDASDADRNRVIDTTRALADAISARGCTTALEFHPGTVTETARSANSFLDALERPEVRTHWQPDPALSADDSLAELTTVAARLAHLHVFSWGSAGIGDRHPLADGSDLWTRAFEIADREGAPLPDGRYALCEYVRGDDPEQFVADVEAMSAWLRTLD